MWSILIRLLLLQRSTFLEHLRVSSLISCVAPRVQHIHSWRLNLNLLLLLRVISKIIEINSALAAREFMPSEARSGTRIEYISELTASLESLNRCWRLEKEK